MTSEGLGTINTRATGSILSDRIGQAIITSYMSLFMIYEKKHAYFFNLLLILQYAGPIPLLGQQTYP